MNIFVMDCYRIKDFCVTTITAVFTHLMCVRVHIYHERYLVKVAGYCEAVCVFFLTIHWYQSTKQHKTKFIRKIADLFD